MKYLCIYNEIKKGIASGRYQPQVQLPQVIELAKTFGVAKGTVEHALKLLQKEGLIRGVKSKGCYVCKPSESHLFYTSTPPFSKVGVLTVRPLGGMFASSYFSSMFKGIDEILRAASKLLYIVGGWNKPYLETIKEINALGLDALISLECEDPDLRNAIEHLKIPLVHVDLLDLDSKHPMIVPNSFQGGSMAVKKLKELGHERILFLHGYTPRFLQMDHTDSIRWKGILEEAGQAPVARVRKKRISPDEDRRKYYLALELAKQRNCTGIISAGGASFQPLSEILNAMSPDEAGHYSVVAFDLCDVPVRIHGKPVLFCKWDGNSMGRRAAEILLHGDEDQIRIQYLPMFLTDNV